MPGCALRTLGALHSCACRTVDVGVLATAFRLQHVDLETKELLKLDEERLKLLRHRYLCPREDHAAVVRLMVDNVYQMSIAEAILRRHRALKV